MVFIFEFPHLNEYRALMTSNPREGAKAFSAAQHKLEASAVRASLDSVSRDSPSADMVALIPAPVPVDMPQHEVLKSPARPPATATESTHVAAHTAHASPVVEVSQVVQPVQIISQPVVVQPVIFQSVIVPQIASPHASQSRTQETTQYSFVCNACFCCKKKEPAQGSSTSSTFPPPADEVAYDTYLAQPVAGSQDADNPQVFIR